MTAQAAFVRVHGAVIALVAVAWSSGAHAQPGAPHFAVLQAAVVALPDSVSGRDFWGAFRGMFANNSFATEKSDLAAGAYAPSLPISNRFVLLEGGGTDTNDAYGVQLSIEWLAAAAPDSKAGTATRPRRRGAPARRALPGKAPAPFASATSPPSAVLSVLVVPPGADSAAVKIAAARDTIVFRENGSLRAQTRVMGGDMALLVLERLHRASGDSAADERLRLVMGRRSADPGVIPAR